MNRQRVKSQINLEELAGGAFAEKLNEALMQVAENIQNPNTEATTKRQINVIMKFAPNKSRQVINTQIAVTTKLAATEAIDTQMVMGVDMRTGQVEIAEYDGQIRGQMSIFDYYHEDERKETTEQKESKPVEEPQEQETPAGKPIDLRKRSQKPEQAERNEALEPGKDFDPDTGEILEMADGKQTEHTGKLVSIDRRTVQA